MSLLQRFGLGTDRQDSTKLVEEVSSLQAALARCKGVATGLRDSWRQSIAIVATAMLVIGFVLGRFSRPVEQSVIAYFHAPTHSSAADPEVAYTAYQKGDFGTALALLRPLAANGDARAQFNLGVMYDEGQGVPQDSAQAEKWYRLAAEQGYAQAQYNLGLWYAKGQGGMKDYVRAHMWFNIAASRFPASDEHGRNAAISNRDVIAGKMNPEEIKDAQELARDWKPQPPRPAS